WQGSHLRLIRNRENAVYEMRLPGGARTALRLHRRGYQEAAAIRSELWWCSELARAGVAVPAPLPATNGDVLIHLASGRYASAIQWVEGEALGEAGAPLPGTMTEQTALHHALGRLVAQVHGATDAMTLPETFTRPRWDIDGLTGDAPFWGRFWDHPALTASEAETLRQARVFLREKLIDHQAQGGDFGPIHADVLRENVLVNNHSLSLIDFDDSGLGFRLYDLGTVLSQNLYEPHYPRIRDALIAGYASLRPVDPAMVEVFTLARTMASIGWAAPRLAPADPVHRRHIDRALMWACKVIAVQG
ncbi:MAG: phosphotransferase, partial [Paracoccaceae bacterium]|nr:phosphotransferase [Paracoccaceae bacterium]